MILTFAVGFAAGVAFSIIGFVCLADWLDEREARRKDK